MRRAAALAATLVLAGASAVAAKTYSAREAAALRCAGIMVLVPSAMFRGGHATEIEVQSAYAIGARILELHVSGTDRQKLTAMQIIADRYSDETHLNDFQTKVDTCLRQFPID